MNKDEIYEIIIHRFDYLHRKTLLTNDQCNNIIIDIVETIDNIVNNLNENTNQ
jgi:hypothetical protein